MKVGDEYPESACYSGNDIKCPECGSTGRIRVSGGYIGSPCGAAFVSGKPGYLASCSPCMAKTTTVVVTAQKPKAGDVVHRSQIPHYNPGACCPFCGETRWTNDPRTGVGWACGLAGGWDINRDDYKISVPCSRYNPMPTNLKVGDVIAPMVPMIQGGNCPVCGETKQVGDTFLCGGKGSWLAGKKNAEYRIIKLCSKVGGTAPMPSGLLWTYREPVPTTCTCETLLGGCTCGAMQREKDAEIRKWALEKLTEAERRVLGVG